MTYAELLLRFRDGPREIPTAPTDGRPARWFRVYAHRGRLYAAAGSDRPDASRISPARPLDPAEWEDMLALYRQRRQGVPVAARAAGISRNASYWFGILQALEA